MRRRFRMKIPVMILCGLLFLVAFTFIVMLLWNAILPDIVNAKPINFWQSLGLLALAKILFGGFGGGRHRHPYWRKRMHEKWQNMTPEEREKFKQEWQERCHWRGRFRSGQPLEGDKGSEAGPSI